MVSTSVFSSNVYTRDIVDTHIVTMQVTTAHDEAENGNGLDISEDGDVPVLIFLHGVGGTGSEWTNFLLKIVPDNTRLFLPTAPCVPVNMFGLIEMNSW